MKKYLCVSLVDLYKKSSPILHLFILRPSNMFDKFCVIFLEPVKLVN